MSETALKNVNAVPLPERRRHSGKKNTMKVALSGPNDENLCVNRLSCKQPASLPSTKTSTGSAEMDSTVEPGSAEIEYVLSEDLKDLDEYESQLPSLLERLDSKEWLVVLEAVNQVRQFAIFHTDLLQPILDSVVSRVIKSLKNPRSALCKTAIMASADMFKVYQDKLLDMLDPLLLQLLLKASQDKRFVCEEAEKALVAMTTWISPNPMLQKLQPYVTHFNPRVRAKASMCVYNSVSRLGAEGIMQYGLELLIQIAAGQLNDRLPEAREAARKLVIDLHAAYCKTPPGTPSSEVPESTDTDLKQDPWEQFCLSKLPATKAQAVLRVTCIAT